MTTTWSPEFTTPSPDIICSRYETTNKTSYIISDTFEGIPDNLLFNIIVWLVLVIIFLVVRRYIWKHGYAGEDPQNVNRQTSLSDNEEINNFSESKKEGLFTGFFTWIPSFLKLKDEDIAKKCGWDAVQYLSFQRYILVYLSVVTVLSIGVILPVNYQGAIEERTEFGRITISNISTDSPLLWVHLTISILFLCLSVLFMWHFSVNLHYEDIYTSTTTLMISNIFFEARSRDIVLQHFQEAYPGSTVEDVQMAYDTAKLTVMDTEREHSLEYLLNAQAINKASGEYLQMVPSTCGQCCCCCVSCGYNKVDAVNFYSKEEAAFREQCGFEKKLALKNALDIAFVTFEDEKEAAKVFTTFKKTTVQRSLSLPESNVSKELGVVYWKIKYSPTRDNINWEDISLYAKSYVCRYLAVNLVVFILTFFLTTPSVVMKLLNQQTFYQEAAETFEFLPSLALWGTSAALPTLISISYRWIPFLTKTAYHHSVMMKTFIFLLLMVIILPSLGLESAQALFQWVTESDGIYEYKFRWQCIFIPDNGVFFVNYVITSTFIGTAVQLDRFGALLMYVIKVAVARSAAERTSVDKWLKKEFKFGVRYAWQLCIFTVVIVYSIPCPLIAPCGLVYFLLKHGVDRYNLYFAYAPSNIDKGIHDSAINFVFVALILLQCTIFSFITLRTSDKINALTVISAIAIILPTVAFLGRAYLGWFKKYEQPTTPYKDLVETSAFDDESASQHKAYIPDVLLERELPVPEQGNSDSIASNLITPSYGSTDNPTTIDIDGSTGDPTTLNINE